MTDYYETKSQPITRLMVWQAYWKVRANKGCAGIDDMDWKMVDKNHPEKPFERYADDIVIHCKTEKQALFLKSMIEKRMQKCNLQLHPDKTKIVHFRGVATRKYPRSLDFLGFTIRLQLVQTKVGAKLMTTSVISRKSRTAILEKFRAMKLHKMRGNIESLSNKLTPIVRGLMNYYCKFWSGHTHEIWHRLNIRLVKWVRWEKDLSTRAALKYLRIKYKEKSGLFPHWKLLHP